MLDNLGEDKSIYLQISEMIEDEILRGIVNEEEQVPSTTELSKFYKINPATAAKGINILVDKEILYKKRGIGMFVQTGAKERIMEARKESFYDTFVKKIITEAKLIGISKEDLKKMIDSSKEM
ncbi:MAG: GntR family transcriptional regulator [Pseudobutyrivibrio sp.]|uniref:GntR family transcriptional regulator n=1 Tax=Pseudobutyrivibrio xylanivorans TaxID=185007 RepID=A0A5P6VQB5_PSEXY|nr:GntR family transcriptional regulator [Pseudobutyrivibrio xylanivorans]MBR5637450.1 GntR family transcriptional regulator [Pseudobutyrivibrio sp.]QFJ54883.1 GntR family transcriptional regulator [Pseudobutyrivibrio xylanivorans]